MYNIIMQNKAIGALTANILICMLISNYLIVRWDVLRWC